LVATPKTPGKGPSSFPPPYRDLLEDFLALVAAAVAS
jgi:hypothetical protein